MAGAPRLVAGRLRLVHGPTPLVHHPRLSARMGVDLWIKRDDLTGNAEGGNKLRKLEFLLADARAQGADTVVTCGAMQSNHARATAVVCAALGLRCELLLWSDAAVGPPDSGNALLCRMVGATIHVISRDAYRRRLDVMAETAAAIERRGGRAYIIPEGGSNGLGALGYVQAMRELRAQLNLGLAGGKPFDLVALACGSGGTAAGVALGTARYQVAPAVVAMAVANDASYFETTIARIAADARALDPSLPEPSPVVVDDQAKGPAYGVASEAQVRFIAEVARLTGLVLDPVYTGKALHGLAEAIHRDGSLIGRRVLFLHTGGVAATLAHPEAFDRLL